MSTVIPEDTLSPAARQSLATFGPERWTPPDLRGRVAVVTGASRNVGRGIATTLGEGGATVYVTGRSSRGGPTVYGTKKTGEPDPLRGTVEDTAELVTAAGAERGGNGIPVRVDHTVDAEVGALFERVEREQGRLDVLVNNVWAGYQHTHSFWDVPFWELEIAHWHYCMDAGPRAYFVASKLAAPLLLRSAAPERPGLVATVSYKTETVAEAGWMTVIPKLTANALTCLMAKGFKDRNVAAVSVAPSGWTHGGDRDEVRAAARVPGGLEEYYRTHQNLLERAFPEFTGRAIAMLAADPALTVRNGQILGAGELSREYGFTDVDGRQHVAGHGPRWPPSGRQDVLLLSKSCGSVGQAASSYKTAAWSENAPLSYRGGAPKEHEELLKYPATEAMGGASLATRTWSTKAAHGRVGAPGPALCLLNQSQCHTRSAPTDRQCGSHRGFGLGCGFSTVLHAPVEHRRGMKMAGRWASAVR
jgi:NAD(P)-dependent dehydrogenase (short-subunit alcohol dehydrogenase family)